MKEILIQLKDGGKDIDKVVSIANREPEKGGIIWQVEDDTTEIYAVYTQDADLIWHMMNHMRFRDDADVWRNTYLDEGYFNAAVKVFRIDGGHYFDFKDRKSEFFIEGTPAI